MSLEEMCTYTAAPSFPQSLLNRMGFYWITKGTSLGIHVKILVSGSRYRGNIGIKEKAATTRKLVEFSGLVLRSGLMILTKIRLK